MLAFNSHYSQILLHIFGSVSKSYGMYILVIRLNNIFIVIRISNVWNSLYAVDRQILAFLTSV